MTSQLEGLKELTKVVADTGDLEAIKKFKPVDATTNPSLILKAFDLPAYKELISTTIKEAASEVTGEGQMEHIIDRLSVAMGVEIHKYLPGYMSTEVAVHVSYDKAKNIEKARKLVDLYEKSGVPRDQVLIKIASTWEGIQAAEELEKEGIQTNLTLLFSDAQARACFEAGVTMVSPYAGRIMDWYSKETGKQYTAEEDPGVIFVRGVNDFAKKHDFKTVVMGASFRNKEEVLALAGLDRLTISADLLKELYETEGSVEQKVFSPKATEAQPPRLTEAEFRWQHAADAMATAQLAAGIHGFYRDTVKLAEMIKSRL